MFNSEVLMDRDGQQGVKRIKGEFMIRQIWQYSALILKPPTFSPFLRQSYFLLPSVLAGAVKTEKHHEARGCSCDPMKPQE